MIKVQRRDLLRGALAAPALVGLSAIVESAPAGAARPRPFTIFMAGDSTAATYASSEIPRAGWGQALPVFLRPYVRVVNEALSGASSKSFVDLGHLDRILTAIEPGDYLLISFGHNDSKTDVERHTDPYTTYQDYLRRYLDGARAAGAHPILVTPVERRRFDAAGLAYESHGDYPDAMRQLAVATGTPLVDLTAASLALWAQLGVEATKSYFLWLAPGESPNYPDGVEDNTHFQAHGAIEVARLVVSALTWLPGRNPQQLHNPDIPDDSLVWPATRPAES